MPITVRNLITNALVTCDAIAIGETPSDAEIFRGLLKFNDKVALMSLDNMWDYTITKTPFTLVSGQSQYTLGQEIGDDIAMDRPTDIISLTVKNNNVWYPLKQVSAVEFENTTRLDDGSIRYLPTVYTYRPDYPSGQIQFYPAPGSAFDIEITTNAMKIEYTLDDELALPPGYNGYLEYALAALLAVDYGVDPATFVAIAQSRLAAIKRQNMQPRTLRLDPLQAGAKNYDIRTDTFYNGRY